LFRIGLPYCVGMKKKIIFSFFLLGFVLICLLLSYPTILEEVGGFLAPEGIGKVDVVILEGTKFIEEDALIIGLRLLSPAKANRLVVVHKKSQKESTFPLSVNYTLLLTQKLEYLGLKKDQFQVLGVPSNHPITLTEAQMVLSNLSKEGVHSAILLCEGFHTRRSYWTYKQVGLPLGIKIIPYPYFIKYRKQTWWHQSRGIYHFISEFPKLFYYIFQGYIPLKSLTET
jgi:hypothetical protein